MTDSIPMPNSAIVLTRAEAELIAEALATLNTIASRAAAVMVGKLDDTDGDPDLEDSDGDAQCSEDEISCGGQTRCWRDGAGPGCEISDPGGDEHDGREPEDKY